MPATVSQLNRMRDTLLRIDQLRSPEHRSFYVSQWEARFAASVPRFTDVRHDIASVLRTANQFDGGLAGWGEIVADGQGPTEAVQEFRRQVQGLDNSGGDAAPTPTEPPARPAVRVFASYAQDDDRVTYGRISGLLRDLAAAYRNETGTDAGVFQDTVSIRLGEDWRQAIADGTDSASVMLAFASPAYLRSDFCRGELADFVAGGTGRTLLPLLFFDKSAIERQFAGDGAWQQLMSVQALPIHELRTADPGSRQWLELRDRIAGRLAELLP